jgi:hypothetical protein
MRQICAILILLIWAGVGAAQPVNIDSVSVQPTSVLVNPLGSTTLTLRWRLNLSSSVPATTTVTSTDGTTNLGNMLGQALSKPVSHPGGGVIVVTITERLFIDRTSAQIIAQTGPGTYNRVFTATGGSTAVASVALQPSSGGSLSFRNLDLRFDDGSNHRTVAAGGALAARLTATSNGRGVLAGSWQVSGPSSAGGNMFRTVERVRRVVAGARRTVLESPPLPTGQPGIYQVRFVFDGTADGGADPATVQLTYSVVGPQDRQTVVRLLSPAPGDRLSGATRFSWQPVSGASRYRLEFLSDEPGGLGFARLTAVDTTEPAAELRSFTLQRLLGPEKVYWSVIAVGPDGQQIAISPGRRLE